MMDTNAEAKSKRAILLHIPKSIGKLSFYLIQRLLITFFCFCFFNAICVFIGVWRYVSTQRIVEGKGYLIGICLTGLLFIFLSIYFTYKHLLKRSFRTIYVFLSPLFLQIAKKIVHNLKTGKINMDNLHIEKIVNTGHALSDIYGERIPLILKKVVNFAIRQIPFSAIVRDSKTEIIDKDETQASGVLYNAIDSYVIKHMLIDNRFTWLYLFAINAVIQTILIILIK